MPIFPLNTVVFPGQAMPLHIFEDRYRDMVSHLLAVPDRVDRLFGVVAIREGYEVGGHEARSMYRTGCVMQLTAAEGYPDGRYDIASVGRARMRVLSTDTSGTFITAEVDLLDDPAGSPTPPEATAAAAARALAGFMDYRQLIAELGGVEGTQGPLPRDPDLLSYALSATCPLPLPERQRLLESPSTAERLGLLRRLMREEVRAMTAVPSLPATEVARSGWHPN